MPQFMPQAMQELASRTLLPGTADTPFAAVWRRTSVDSESRVGHPVVLRHSNVSLTQACCIETADVDLRAAYEALASASGASSASKVSVESAPNLHREFKGVRLSA